MYEKTLDDEVHFAGQHIPPELIPSGRFAGGLVNDIKRRLPHYIGDYIRHYIGHYIGHYIAHYVGHCLRYFTNHFKQPH